MKLERKYTYAKFQSTWSTIDPSVSIETMFIRDTTQVWHFHNSLPISYFRCTSIQAWVSGAASMIRHINKFYNVWSKIQEVEPALLPSPPRRPGVNPNTWPPFSRTPTTGKGFLSLLHYSWHIWRGLKNGFLSVSLTHHNGIILERLRHVGVWCLRTLLFL
jgi:hypothetical protein